MKQQNQQIKNIYPIELDFSEGEDEDWFPLETSKVFRNKSNSNERRKPF